MKIGYGRNRIIWYVVIGAVAGTILTFEDVLLDNLLPGSHNWVMAILIPIFAGGMALLAIRENSLFQWGHRLDESRKRVNELMLSATANKRRSATFEQESLATCWKQLGCDKEDCPAFGLEHSRCWLIAGTFCRGQVQGKFARKLKDCRLCEIYKAATADPVQEITENFYAMNYLLGEREEQLEQAYGEARTRSEKLAGLVSLSEAALSTVHLSEMMQKLLESAASFVGADFGLVFLSDTASENLTAQASYGLQSGASARMATRVGEGVIGQAFAGRYIAVSEDLTTDSRATNKFLKAINARTLISLPLQMRDQMLGMLVLGTFTPHQYTEEEKDSLIVAADRLAIAIENAQLAGEVGRDREQFELMAAINRDVGSGDGISSVYDSFLVHASGLIDFDQASLALWHPDEGEVEIVVMKTEAPRTWMGEGLRLPKDALPVGKVIESRRPLIRDEIGGDEYPTDKLLVQEGIRSAVYFPLVSQGEVLGTVILGSFESAAFTREDVELLEPVIRQLGLVLDNARLLQEAQGSSLIDSLTSLHNHRFLFEAVSREVARSERFGRPVSLLMIDLDGFKSFNEKYGHDEGDRVLRRMGRILSGEVREIDITARSGGDEFSILLPEVGVTNGSTEDADALHVAERIRGAVAGESFAPDGDFSITLSMGIAEFPAHTASAEELLERAAWAQREAKARGKNRVVVAPPLRAFGEIHPVPELQADPDAGGESPDVAGT
ncbi:MAG: diguanylate cyclase [Actinobacteria bacterium]|nr:diguanylate cyclase [Actinomycetota bacterium]